MKNYLLIAVLFAAVLVACTNKENKEADASQTTIKTPLQETPVKKANPLREIPDNAPQFVRDAVDKAPENALIGIGTAGLTSINMSRNTAATRARADISRQLDTVVEHSQDGSVTLKVSNTILEEAVVIEEDIDDDGNFWVVVMINM